MFWKKKEKEELVGASAKLAAAERMKTSTRMDSNPENAKGQSYSQTIPVVFIFVMSVVLTLLIMESSLISLSSWRPTGIHNLDMLLVGKNIHKFTGNGDLDRLIVAFIRGLVLFLMAAFIPFVSALMTRIGTKGKINPFVACWATIVGIPLVYLLMAEVFLPLF
ncbi:MAG: hypothetical protein OEL54_06195 [Flavobacteriaceae bacterium]|nr:hypothetical protein [Flavobacteriaceae bacterium]